MVHETFLSSICRKHNKAVGELAFTPLTIWLKLYHSSRKSLRYASVKIQRVQYGKLRSQWYACFIWLLSNLHYHHGQYKRKTGNNSFSVSTSRERLLSTIVGVFVSPGNSCVENVSPRHLTPLR